MSFFWLLRLRFACLWKQRITAVSQKPSISGRLFANYPRITQMSSSSGREYCLVFYGTLLGLRESCLGLYLYVVSSIQEVFGNHCDLMSNKNSFFATVRPIYFRV